jgi:hypothetical protein
VSREFDALNIDELRVLQIECPVQAEAAEELCQVRLVQFRVGRPSRIAGSIILPKDARMLGRGACGNRRVVAGIRSNTVAPVVNRRITSGSVPPNPASGIRGLLLIRRSVAAPNQNGIPAGNHPCALTNLATVVIPEKAKIVEGTMSICA